MNKEVNKRAPRIHVRLADEMWAGLTSPMVTVPGTAAAAKVLPRLAAQILQLRNERAQFACEIDKVLDDHPLACVLTSMPGVGVKIAARLLAEIGGEVSAFPTAAHLAAYAGLAPVTRRSGISIRSELVNRGGGKQLKNAVFMAAFTSWRADPASKAYYERKRAEGKKHNAALICLALRKTDVPFVMIRHLQPYTPLMPAAA